MPLLPDIRATNSKESSWLIKCDGIDLIKQNFKQEMMYILNSLNNKLWVKRLSMYMYIIPINIYVVVIAMALYLIAFFQIDSTKVFQLA